MGEPRHHRYPTTSCESISGMGRSHPQPTPSHLLCGGGWAGEGVGGTSWSLLQTKNPSECAHALEKTSSLPVSPSIHLSASCSLTHLPETHHGSTARSHFLCFVCRDESDQWNVRGRGYEIAMRPEDRLGIQFSVNVHESVVTYMSS